MKYILYLFLLFSVSDLFPQDDSTASDSAIVEFDFFTVQLKNNILLVTAPDGSEISSRKFNDPIFTTADLDSDEVEEYVLIDYNTIDEKKDFTIYIYNTVDTFYCVDSIRSGFYEPYVYFSNEVKSNVIITGIPGFNQFNVGKTDIFLPINIWKYGEDGIVLINDQIYDLYKSENESVIDYLDDYFNSNIKNCSSSEQVLNVIAAGYTNLKNAGELSVANQFLLKYYLCPDIDSFKKKIEKLL
jgi:hypothetical protein